MACRLFGTNPSNQRWGFFDLTLRNIFQWHFISNSKLFTTRKLIQNIISNKNRHFCRDLIVVNPNLTKSYLVYTIFYSQKSWKHFASLRHGLVQNWGSVEPMIFWYFILTKGIPIWPWPPGMPQLSLRDSVHNCVAERWVRCMFTRSKCE